MLPAAHEWDEYIRQAGESKPRKTIWCSNCHTEWTISWLLKVAVAEWGLETLARSFGKDVLAKCYGVTERHLNRLIAKARLSDPVGTMQPQEASDG